MELKDRIIEEASYLFFQNGIRSMTMSDIASHLGISKRTLYEVFKDKEELLEACIKKKMDESDREMEELVNESKNSIDTLMRIYSKHLSDMHKMNKSVVHDLRKYHPQVYKKIECEQKKEVDMFIPLFQKGVEQGLMRDDTNFEILLWLLKAQFKTLMESNFMPTDKYPISEFVRAIMLTFMRGIATDKGNEMIDELIIKYNNKELKDKNRL